MEKRKNKVVKTVMSVLWWAAVILLCLLLITVLSAKLRGEVPRVFGFSVMRIVSGSMEPKIPTGTYILVRAADPEEVKAGDIISFYSRDPAIYGLPNTHSVVEIVQEGDALSFVTKGAANAVADRVRAEGEDLIGIHVCNLNGLTHLSALMAGKGMFAVVLVLWISAFGMIAYSMVKRRGEDKTEDET